MILSLLICHLPARKILLEKLLFELRSQISAGQYKVEILVDQDNGSTGSKRQRLLEKSQGDYVAFIDDDDMVSGDYISSIVPHLGAYDAIGFQGEISTNGRNVKLFTISKEHGYEEKGGIYYRFNNHLTPVRRDIALKIGFKDISFGEDHDYALRLHESGLIKTEKYIYKTLYFYRFRTGRKTYQT